MPSQVGAGYNRSYLMRYGVSLAGIPLEKKGEYAKLAEDAGFGLAVTNDNRGVDDCFVAMAAMALATKSIEIGSGICRAFVRTPIATATGAMTVDRLSGGRALVGLGGGTRRQLDYGFELEQGSPRMKELIDIMRLMWENHPNLFEYTGKFYQLQGAAPGFSRARTTPTGRRIPVYIATIREAMTRMMGQIADGSMGHPVWHFGYIDRVLMPNLMIGLQRASRQRQDFDLTAFRITTVARSESERKDARRAAARIIAGYLQVRSYSIVFDCVGWTKEKEALYDAALTRRDAEAATDAITDEMIDAIALSGTVDDIRRQVERYEGVLDRIVYYGGGEENIRNYIDVLAPANSVKR
jgi:alkanesulfonate monooxygenase SsuD/methylene tetrahydromethanopterin reductase-like flavin-dependent oxidoreductase (luciferase family)